MGGGIREKWLYLKPQTLEENSEAEVIVQQLRNHKKFGELLELFEVTKCSFVVELL